MRVPYDKGANLLLYLERQVGGLPVFLPWLRDYFKSISTDQWQQHLLAFFESNAEATEKLKKVDWQAWLHGTDKSLPVENEYDTSLADVAYSLAKRWTSATEYSHFSASDIKHFSAGQQIVMLETILKSDFDAKAVDALNAAYGFDDTPNAEIKLRWYQVSLRTGPKYSQSAATWVVDKGRMKFCRPVYRLIYAVAPELARKTFGAHRSFYHPIAANIIAKDIGLEQFAQAK